jgi:hypothetical protein
MGFKPNVPPVTIILKPFLNWQLFITRQNNLKVCWHIKLQKGVLLLLSRLSFLFSSVMYVFVHMSLLV